MFWEPLVVDKAHGMLLTSSLCANIFIISSNISLADKVNLLVCTWSFLNPFKWEFFFLNLCQETLPTVCNVSKPEVNTSMVKQITLWWYSPAPTWFEINNPHFLISLFLCWLPGGSCTFELNLKQFNINRNELGSAPPQISLCSEDQPDTSPAVTAVGVCTT